MAHGAIDEVASLDSVLNRIQLPALDGRGLLVGGVRVPFARGNRVHPYRALLVPSTYREQHSRPGLGKKRELKWLSRVG
jgi:hypothetical protein